MAVKQGVVSSTKLTHGSVSVALVQRMKAKDAAGGTFRSVYVIYVNVALFYSCESWWCSNHLIVLWEVYSIAIILNKIASLSKLCNLRYACIYVSIQG